MTRESNRAAHPDIAAFVDALPGARVRWIGLPGEAPPSHGVEVRPCFDPLAWDKVRANPKLGKVTWRKK